MNILGEDGGDERASFREDDPADYFVDCEGFDGGLFEGGEEGRDVCV